MNRPSVTALVAVCRVVLGSLTATMADALAAAEAWAAGEEPSHQEFAALYVRLGKDVAGEAVYWTLSAAYERDDEESAYLVEQALATLAALPGWDDASVQALYATQVAPRDTVPAPAPEWEEAA